MPNDLKEISLEKTSELLGKLLRDAIEIIVKTLNEFYDSLPMYVIRELQHPRKKPRGSIRRKRKYKSEKNRSGKE